MLSSQPMCFNLFGPLKYDLELATRLMQGLPGFPGDAEVTRVCFEYAPDKASHLDDRTTFDAYVEYHRPGNIRGFIGIETKLIEPFSQKSYPFAPGYARWKTSPNWWWDAEEKVSFPDMRFNQLWRNHLLGFAMLSQAERQYDEGLVAVVWHPKDTQCTKAMEAYREHLTRPGNASLMEWSLEQVVSSWTSTALDESHQHWLKAFHTRYLALDGSEPYWQAFRDKQTRKSRTADA
jgi:hypothetical protein